MIEILNQVLDRVMIQHSDFMRIFKMNQLKIYLMKHVKKKMKEFLLKIGKLKKD